MQQYIRPKDIQITNKSHQRKPQQTIACYDQLLDSCSVVTKSASFNKIKLCQFYGRFMFVLLKKEREVLLKAYEHLSFFVLIVSASLSSMA